MSTRILSVMLVALLSLPLPANACSCVPSPPPKEALAASSAVFSGKVLAIEKEGFQHKVTIQVALVWKGAVEDKVMVLTSNNGATCGFGFMKDESYLIYCHRPKEEKAPLMVSLCSRTASLAAAKEDIKELGPGTMPGGK